MDTPGIYFKVESAEHFLWKSFLEKLVVGYDCEFCNLRSNDPASIHSELDYYISNQIDGLLDLTIIIKTLIPLLCKIH